MGISNDDLPTPPSHPHVREHALTEPKGTTTVLWAYTRLVGHFHPSIAYIPPDPLLPLRTALLHQPVGSGSLSTPSQDSSGNVAGRPSGSSRWQLSFGTGTIGNSTQPSLTGSLFGLAKDLVTGGSGGSLEEERKRVWNLKDLPVLETTRSLLAVDMKLKEGETKECECPGFCVYCRQRLHNQSTTRYNFQQIFPRLIEVEPFDFLMILWYPSAWPCPEVIIGKCPRTLSCQSGYGPMYPVREFLNEGAWADK